MTAGGPGARPRVRRRDLVALVAGGLALRATLAVAQQPKMPTVGVLVIPDGQLSAFRKGLRDLGHVEGQNIRLEIRSAKGDVKRLPELAAELVGLKVDIIVAVFTPAALAAKRATSDIPIVMMGVGDPVGMGIIASLAHPGGNITGNGMLVDLLTEKNVELLRQLLPSVARIAALCNSPDPFSKVFLNHIRIAGAAQKMDVVPFMIAADAELEPAFAAMAEKKVEAVMVQPTLPQKVVCDLAIKYRLPTAAPTANFAANGGLMNYAGNPEDLERGAAVFVDKILKGANPSSLPVQQPTRFELTLNMKTAKAISLAIGQSFLDRADNVIE